MMAYEFQTKEGCRITARIEGQHVAAGLDELLGCVRGPWHRVPGRADPEYGLVAPMLVDALVVHLAKMKPMAIVAAAHHGGCMPGMLLSAVYAITQRARFWHRKALAYEAAQLRKEHGQAASGKQHQQAPENEGDTPEDHVTHEIHHGKAETAVIEKSKRRTAKVKRGKTVLPD